MQFPAFEQKFRSRNEAIQGQRAIAALLVVVAHSILTLRAKAGVEVDYDAAYSIGELGVRMFFVISGFIMTVTMNGRFGRTDTAGDFVWRRLIRIAPIYWLATAVYLGKQYWDGEMPGLREIVLSYAFIPYLDDNDLFRPVYGLGWTLNYEMLFYGLFALALCFRRSVGLSLLALAFLVLLAMGQSNLTAECRITPCQALHFYTQPIVLYFAFGVLLGLLRCKYGAILQTFGVGTYTAMLVCLIIALAYSTIALTSILDRDALVSSTWVFVCVGATACAFAGEDQKPDVIKHWMVATGDASYSIYLTHSFVLGPAGVVWAMLFSGEHKTVFVALMLVTSTLVGLATYRWLEEPLLKFMRTRRPPAFSSAGV